MPASSPLPFRVDLWLPHDTSEPQKRSAQLAFAQALTDSLGDSALVLPTYQAYVRIIQAQGTGTAEGIDAEQLPDDQRYVFEAWRLAEAAALHAVFGPHRHMGEALYDIHPETSATP